jgi:hypothetical protein
MVVVDMPVPAIPVLIVVCVMVKDVAVGAVLRVVASVGLDVRASLARAPCPCFSVRGDSPDCDDGGR